MKPFSENFPQHFFYILSQKLFCSKNKKKPHATLRILRIFFFFFLKQKNFDRLCLAQLKVDEKSGSLFFAAKTEKSAKKNEPKKQKKVKSNFTPRKWDENFSLKGKSDGGGSGCY